MFNKLRKKIYPWKWWLRDILRQPRMQTFDPAYNRYWHARDIGVLNQFQKDRADLSIPHIVQGASVMDIGAGSGNLLEYIRKQRPLGQLWAIDLSSDALALAAAKGMATLRGDIADEDSRKKLPAVDYLCLFEVLEHLPHPEEVLQWAIKHARKGVFFSVPNTGFFVYRLQLLLGRFPVQWRAHPSEHLRFWTFSDMQKWLLELGCADATLMTYQGGWPLNLFWPSLFSAGLFVKILRE